MKQALMTEWMRECATCVELVDALNGAEGAPVLIRLNAFEGVRAHLVEKHLALLPGYAEDCANCQEWEVLAAKPEGLALRVVPVLGREALLHRAGHLLYDAA